jgi:hypothetical protein
MQKRLQLAMTKECLDAWLDGTESPPQINTYVLFPFDGAVLNSGLLLSIGM